MAKVYIEGRREGYGTDQITRTLTVRELIDFLEKNYEDDDKIYLKNDNGYTYGSITETSFETEEDEDGEAEDDYETMEPEDFIKKYIGGNT